MGKVKRSKSMEKKKKKKPNTRAKAGVILLHNRVEPTHLMCQCVRLKLLPGRCYLKRLSTQGRDFSLLPLVHYNLFHLRNTVT